MNSSVSFNQCSAKWHLMVGWLHASTNACQHDKSAWRLRFKTYSPRKCFSLCPLLSSLSLFLHLLTLLAALSSLFLPLPELKQTLPWRNRLLPSPDPKFSYEQQNPFSVTPPISLGSSKFLSLLRHFTRVHLLLSVPLVVSNAYFATKKSTA